jgi:hypothetical protein
MKSNVKAHGLSSCVGGVGLKSSTDVLREGETIASSCDGAFLSMVRSLPSPLDMRLISFWDVDSVASDLEQCQ